MKKIIAIFLCLIMILTIALCNRQNISNKEKNKDTNTDTSTDETANTSNANYNSILEIYRLIVEKFSIVNQNPLAVAAELGIQDDGEKESFLRLYSSIHQFYPGREQEDPLSPHYKLGCGYAIKDLNGDGVDELVLLTDEYRIIAVYSLINDIPTLLGSYIKKDLGWSFRNWIDAEGRIHVVRTDGLDLYHHSIFEISNGHLIELCTYGYDIFRENGVIVGKLYQTIHDNTVFITEQEVTEFDRQYGNPLNAGEAGNITMVSAKLTSTSLYTEAEIAMEMYEAALKNEICVLDKDLGEIKLQDCRFPSNNLRLGECEILSKAILDMDGDGINEYVIQSETKDHIVLRYYNGKVYSYCFESKNFFNLCTDGSYYWIDSYEIDNCTRGLNQITFDASSLRIKEVYRITQTSPHDYGDNNHKYYVDGKQITREEFMDYYDSNYTSKTIANFSPLDISCDYPISSEKAFELASDYWGFKSGNDEGAAGSIAINKIVILEKTGNDKQNYHIAWQLEVYTNHVIDVWYAQPPTSVSTYKDLIVDAFTGEIREYSEAEIAMEMYEQTLNGLAFYETPYSQIPLCECENLKYAYVDLDGDSINELIIDCGDTLILRYYEGTVYFYELPFRSLYYLEIDGSYSWNHIGSDFEYGEDQIYFEGSALKTRELWRIVNDGELDAEYYIGNKQVTEEEILKYFEDDSETRIEFSPLKVSWLNKISRYEAITIAENYWESFNIEENGYRVEHAANRGAPDSVYVMVIKKYIIDHYSTFDEIWIDKNTGEAIIPYSYPPGAKG